MVRRRTVLAGVGSAGSLAVAGCLGSGSSETVAASLNGLRWEMPCEGSDPGAICNSARETFEESADLQGSDGTTYGVTLRFRGVAEQMSYEGGTKDDFWYVGGEKSNTSYNVYRLDVSAPEQHFFLNAGQSGISRCFELDYTRTVEMEAGATVTLSADAQDGRLVSNRNGDGDPIVVADVPPAPDPYNGQFIQMDVESVSER